MDIVVCVGMDVAVAVLVELHSNPENVQKPQNSEAKYVPNIEERFLDRDRTNTYTDNHDFIPTGTCLPH